MARIAHCQKCMMDIEVRGEGSNEVCPRCGSRLSNLSAVAAPTVAAEPLNIPTLPAGSRNNLTVAVTITVILGALIYLIAKGVIRFGPQEYAPGLVLTKPIATPATPRPTPSPQPTGKGRKATDKTAPAGQRPAGTRQSPPGPSSAVR